MWLKDRFIIPKTDIALFAAALHCLLHFKSLLIHTDLFRYALKAIEQVSRI